MGYKWRRELSLRLPLGKSWQACFPFPVPMSALLSVPNPSSCKHRFPSPRSLVDLFLFPRFGNTCQKCNSSNTCLRSVQAHAKGLTPTPIFAESAPVGVWCWGFKGLRICPFDVSVPSLPSGLTPIGSPLSVEALKINWVWASRHCQGFGLERSP